jgi:hypothetical protein
MCVVAGCFRARVAAPSAPEMSLGADTLSADDALYCGIHAVSAAVAASLSDPVAPRHARRWAAERAGGLRVVIHRV